MSTQLQVGDQAPDFTLADADGHQVSLASFVYYIATGIMAMTILMRHASSPTELRYRLKYGRKQPTKAK